MSPDKSSTSLFLPDDIVDRQIADGLIPPELKEKISFVLLRKHRHQTKKPIHRSLADLGKSSNAASSTFCVSFSCLFKYQSAAISVVQPAIVMMLPCSFACPYEITSALFDHFSSAGALSDRSSQANLNRSTSSTSGVHRSTEDLRSWQSSSLGRLRESAPTIHLRFHRSTRQGFPSIQ